ncbi:efflux RND transporter permease subunit [Methylobacterium aquaticum]|uniref:efflux RND transporter permease subunit n=1 Tax=Methylobacterium aquaticum TaxID=270351 RepID=UPI003D18367C
MSFSDPFIRRPVLAIVVTLVLVVLGVFALTRLSIRELPSFEVPLVTITTLYPGASAEQVERQITTRIEQAVAAVSGIDVISSSSGPGMSAVSVNFSADTSPDAAANDVRAKVTSVLSQLPRDAALPVVDQLSADAAPVLYLGLTSDTLSPLELTDIARRLVRPRIATLTGVADVQILGERRFAIRVALDPLELAARGMAPSDVAQALQTQNVDLPSGEIIAAGRRIPLVAHTTLNLPEEFNDLVLRAGRDWSLQLRDVGRAQVGAQATDTGVMINGKNALALSVLRQGQANALDVAQAVRKALADTQMALPSSVTLDVTFDSSLFIAASVRRVFETILEAVLLVTIVILAFLASFRAAIITLVTIPVSLIGTLGVLLALGYSINTFTLLAMVLAVGLVVDDAIIDVENVQRHIRLGLTPVDAAFIGSREIGFAIVATTATLASVFLPIGLMPGLLGSLFREFAFSLAAAVIISGAVSRTLSPMMCSRMLSAREGRAALRIERGFARCAAAYAGMIRGLLRRRWLLVPLALLLGAIGYAAGQRVTTELVPIEDPGYVFVRFKGEAGASYDTMAAQAKAITAVFDTVPERQTSLIMIGTPTRNEGFAFLVLKPWEQRSRSANTIGRSLTPALDAIPGALTTVIDPNPLAGGGQAPVQFVIRTTGSYEQLAGVMDDFLRRAARDGRLVRPVSDLSLSTPRVDVEIDRAMASNLKVPVSVIGETLATVLGARNVSQFSWQGELFYVVLELEASVRNRLDTLNEISVRSTDGKLLPLAAFVHPVLTAGPDALRHFNQLPAAQLTATLAPGASIGAAIDGLEQLAKETLPSGYSYDFAGLSRQMKQANVQVGFVFILALVFIYLFLAAQFESFRDPVIVLAVVPFAIVGALVGLACVKGGVNIYSAIGMITLVGLVAKNGIIITEFINQQRDEGVPRLEAVAVAASLRLRPVLMTSIATILGALPLMLDGGPGGVSRNQIGAVIVGGMAFGLVVSLLIVPLVYSLLSSRHRPALPEPPPVGRGRSGARDAGQDRGASAEDHPAPGWATGPVAPESAR